MGIDTKPFIKVSVKDLFWGYPSVLLSMDRQNSNPNCVTTEDLEFGDMFGYSDEAAKDQINCDILPGNLVPFGIFSARNGTSVDKRTVKTGKTDPYQKGEMVAWHGKTR